MEFLFWMALGAALLAVTNRLSVVLRITGVRFMAPRYSLAPAAAISDEMRALLQAAIGGLPGQWEQLAWVHSTSLAHRPPLPAALLAEVGGATVVLVRPAYYPEPGARVVFSFMSWRASGELVMTTSELHLWLLQPDRAALEDPLALDAAAQWHRHRQRVTDCAPLQVSPEALLADLEERYQQTVAAMLSRGLLSQTEGPDALRYTLSGAWPEISAVRHATVKALALQDRRREALRPRPPSRGELLAEVEAGYRASWS